MYREKKKKSYGKQSFPAVWDTRFPLEQIFSTLFLCNLSDSFLWSLHSENYVYFRFLTVVIDLVLNRTHCASRLVRRNIFLGCKLCPGHRRVCSSWLCNILLDINEM